MSAFTGETCEQHKSDGFSAESNFDAAHAQLTTHFWWTKDIWFHRKSAKMNRIGISSVFFLTRVDVRKENKNLKPYWIFTRFNLFLSIPFGWNYGLI